MLISLIVLAPVLSVLASGKRGLIGVNNGHSFQDQPTLVAGNACSWAYNYGTQPGNATWFGSLEFVPQLWGGNNAATFESEVLANEPATQHVIAFNEPDGQGPGQATMTPEAAAALWKEYVEPLRAHNIKLGSPGCTGTDSGIEWLVQFYGNCTTCHIDFITTHWYGNFEGLAAHLGNLYNVFNGTKMWVTELGIYGATVEESAAMFNSSISWLDGLSWVDRYAWFGSFRSSDAAGAENATFLNARGALTSIGKEYLYTNASAVTASTSGTSGSTSATASSSASVATPLTFASSSMAWLMFSASLVIINALII